MTPCTRGIQGIGSWGWKAGWWQLGSRGEAWGLPCEEASRCRLALSGH